MIFEVTVRDDDTGDPQPSVHALVDEMLFVEHRPESADALAERLRSVLVEPWTEERASQWWQRHHRA